MANFHAADLWVALVPDVSKVGPAMQQAGKEADKGFSEGVKDIGKSLEDKLKEAGKKAGGHFSDEFKTGVKDVGKVIIAEYGPTIGAELGKVVGRSIADAAKDIPGFDTFSDVLDKIRAHGEEAQAALHSMGDAIAGIKEHDPGKVLGSLQDALKNAEPVAKEFGVDISGWQQHLSNVSTGLSGVNTALAGIKDKNPAAVIGGMTTALQGAEPLAKAMGVDLHGWEEPLGTIAAGADTFVTLKSSFVGIAEVAPAAAAAFSAIAAPLALIAADALALKLLWDEMRDISGQHAQQTYTGPLPNQPMQPQTGPSAQPGQARPGLLPGPGQTVPGGAPPGYHLGPGGIPIKDRAFGGPIDGPGAVGKDSVLLWGAPGEHMLTADDVSAMGGHGGVHNFRRALHRQGGGAFNPNIVLDPTIAARTNLSPLAPPDVGVTWNPAWGEPTGPGWQTYPDNSQDPLNPFKKRFGGAIPGLQGGGAVGYSADQAAAAIIRAAHGRGLNQEQTLAALSVGLLETNLGQNPMTNVQQNQSGTVVQGLFQQDSGYNKYGNRTDPDSAARGFVDQFIARGGQGMDPYQGAVKVQVGTYGADYVRSFRGQAMGYYNRNVAQGGAASWFPGGGTPLSGGPDGGGGGAPTGFRSWWPGYGGSFGGGSSGGGPAGGGPSGSGPSGGGGQAPLGTDSDPVYTAQATGEGGGPGGGRPGGGADGGDTGAKQFGSDLITGALEAVGLDGSVFKGFASHPIGSPLNWGITKLGTGLVNTLFGGGQGGQGGGGAGGLSGLLGQMMPGAGNVAPGAGPGGGDIHNYNGTFGGLIVNQTGVDNGPQGFSNVLNSSDYQAGLQSGYMATAQP